MKKKKKKRYTEYFKLHCLSENVIITGQQGVANVPNDDGAFPSLQNKARQKKKPNDSNEAKRETERRQHRR